MSKSTGTVKWFNSTKGFGFVTPDDGSEDVFVHQSSIHAKGYRNLAEGEKVEFEVETDSTGRKKAINVTGPQGDYVKGEDRRGGDGGNFRSGGGGGYGGGDRSYGGGGGGGYGGGDRNYHGGGGGYGGGGGGRQGGGYGGNGY